MRYDLVTVVASRRGIPQCELVAQLPPEFGTPVVCLVEADERSSPRSRRRSARELLREVR